MAGMQHELDHVAILVRDLGEATAAWEQLGFEVHEGGRHIGRGTENAIVRFGLDYLELMAVCDVEEAQQAGRNELMEFLAQWPGGIIGFVFTTHDIEQDEAHLSAAGASFTQLPGGKRYRPDGSLMSWRSLILEDGWWRSRTPLISQFDQPDAERLSHERIGQHPNGANHLRRVDILVRDLDSAMTLYHETFGLPLIARDTVPGINADSARFRVGRAEVTLLRPTGPGLAADALAERGEGPFQIVMTTASLEQARQASGCTAPAPGVANSLLLEPDRALSVRMVLQS